MSLSIWFHESFPFHNVINCLMPIFVSAEGDQGTYGRSKRSGFLYHWYPYWETKNISNDFRPQETLRGTPCEDNFLEAIVS